MALVTCPECGREKVSDTALACPGCGYAIKEHFEKIKKEIDKEDDFEQVSQGIEKPEEDIKIIQKSENDTATSVADGVKDKDDKKNKKAILIGVVVLVIVFLLAVSNINRGEKGIDISKIDMTTSLIKGESMVHANEAYKLVQERLMSYLGDDYVYEENNKGGYIGIYKNGDTEYSYIISCTDKRDNGKIISSESKETPKCVHIYDCTSKEPTVESLSLLISVFLDNTKQPVIESVLEEKIKNSPSDFLPNELAIAINGKVFYVTSDVELEDSYMVELAGDYYNYGEINPLEALDYIFGNDETARNRIQKLTDEQGNSLVEYYMQHEQECFESYDAFLESGVSDNGKEWLPVDKNENWQKVLEITDVYVTTDSKGTTCHATIKNNGTKTYNYMEVAVIFRNDLGEVLEMGGDHVSESDGLEPGESLSFLVSVRPNEKITNCDVYINSVIERTK